MIAFHKKSIAFLKNLSKTGNKEDLIKWKKQRAALLQKAVNDNLGNPTHVRIMRAISFAGELRGIMADVNLFENVDIITSPDEQQLEIWKKHLEEIKNLPIRKDE